MSAVKSLSPKAHNWQFLILLNVDTSNFSFKLPCSILICVVVSKNKTKIMNILRGKRLTPMSASFYSVFKYRVIMVILKSIWDNQMAEILNGGVTTPVKWNRTHVCGVSGVLVVLDAFCFLVITTIITDNVIEGSKP